MQCNAMLWWRRFYSPYLCACRRWIFAVCWVNLATEATDLSQQKQTLMKALLHPALYSFDILAQHSVKILSVRQGQHILVFTDITKMPDTNLQQLVSIFLTGRRLKSHHDSTKWFSTCFSLCYVRCNVYCHNKDRNAEKNCFTSLLTKM